jgi:hypothetical protein
MILRRKKRIVKKHTFQSYRRQKALNYSKLKAWDEAPIKAEQEDQDSPTFAFGRGAHALVLEGPDKFTKAFEVLDVSSRNTKAYKEAVQETDKTILLRPEAEKIQGIRDAVKAHKKAKTLLMEGHRECSAYWSEQFGNDWLAMKIRMDGFQPKRRIFVDMKTTTSASQKHFPKDIAKYGYGKQMAFYQRGLKEITGEWFAPIIVAIEKEPPHLIGIYSLDADSLQHCRVWVQDKLEQYHSWLKQPKAERRMGYDPRIFEVRLPQWAFYE